MAASNYITFETDFGPERTNYWHGVDVTLNARTRWGLTFSGGTSTGRSVQDDCATTVLIDPGRPVRIRATATTPIRSRRRCAGWPPT